MDFTEFKSKFYAAAKREGLMDGDEWPDNRLRALHESGLSPEEAFELLVEEGYHNAE